MVRKFTEEEKNILYKGIPLHQQGSGLSMEVIFFILIYLTIFFLEMIVLSRINSDFPQSVFMDIIAVIWITVGGMFQLILLFIVFNFFRDQIVYSRYGKYALENTFEVENIHIEQGSDPLNFITQLFDNKGNKIEVKTDVELVADSIHKKRIISELEKYRTSYFGTINMTIEALAGMKNKYDQPYISLLAKNISTPAKLDFTDTIYTYDKLLKTKYELIYSLKTKEFLFINVEKGNRRNFKGDVIIKDIGNKIQYISYEM
ncbi:hypothetical protein HNP38_002195 [Chryseobacterium defluvii]|uniref:Uncharacterized protein n=1 Tax=Chryseobacterium defluvii TaxID=160396 RepID=A0A840KBT2_9FLAO|nr:hypothetical protein [Chryseobacterium defluvii]MBB4806899.1 hypothetical protein [Chryseobacterium defluvii]